jgi:hypothetical protein
MFRTHAKVGCSLAALLCLCCGVAQAADFPAGTFTRKIENDTWSFSYKDGKVTVKRNGELAVEATCKATKDEIEVKDVSGPFAIQNDKGGKYKWKLDGNKITFEKLSDEAQGRAAALTGGAWTKE